MQVTIDGVQYAPVGAAEEVALSVLVPSVSSRRKTFAPLIAEALFTQHESLSTADRARVEILMLTDAKGVLIGDKRNAMVRMARGQYVVFVDDDDRVEPDYLQSLLTATKHGADCITFDASVKINGGPARVCHYSLKYDRDHNTSDKYHRLPNHITAVRRILALACPFPSKQRGEDSEYAARLKPTLRSEYRVERVLYHYDYSDATTETQGKQERTDAPVVDVVILSKATTVELQRMCQKAIDTCIAGAGHRKVNVIVMEQAQALYDNATVVPNLGEFNYNRSANAGASSGNAEWLMIANSDLVFQDGWLDALLAAGRDLVSPVDPNNSRQASVRGDEAGWQNGRNFSGWCFMLKRDLWKKIGGFDDCVRYWCSDDVVIEQCRTHGVMPLVVHAARVLHLRSATLKVPDDEMTWGDVRIFNERYGKKAFVTDARYITYCKKLGVTP